MGGSAEDATGTAKKAAKTPPPYRNQNLSTRVNNKHRWRPRADGACKQAKKVRRRKHRLGWIHSQELSTEQGRARLFTVASTAGYVPPSEAGKQRIAVAMEYAKRKARTNPVGLFVKLVTNASWDYGTSIDEDAARKSSQVMRCLPVERRTHRIADVVPSVLRAVVN